MIKGWDTLLSLYNRYWYLLMASSSIFNSGFFFLFFLVSLIFPKKFSSNCFLFWECARLIPASGMLTLELPLTFLHSWWLTHTPQFSAHKSSPQRAFPAMLSIPLQCFSQSLPTHKTLFFYLFVYLFIFCLFHEDEFPEMQGLCFLSTLSLAPKACLCMIRTS